MNLTRRIFLRNGVITLAALGVMLAVILSQLDEPRLQGWLLTVLWAATGLLAGLGSRESRSPLT